MKNYILLAVLFFSSFGTQAFTNPVSEDSQCRLDSVNYSKNFDNEERITIDLIYNNWTLTESTTVSGMTRHFDFNEIGIVKITTSFADTSIPTTIKNMVWELTSEDGESLLILTDINTDSYTTYRVNETCDGLSLNNILLNKQLDLIARK